MDALLQKILSPVVAIPYSVELLEQIEQGCQHYIDTVEEPYDCIAELALSFMTQQECKKFYMYVDNFLMSNGNKFHLPHYVSSLLAGYTVNKMVIGETVEEKQAIYATIVMNEMIIIKGSKQQVYADVLTPLFDYHIYNYLKKTDHTKICLPTEIISESLEEEFNFSSDDDDQKKTLIMIMKEAELFRCIYRIHSSDIKNETDVYKRIYKGLTYFFNNLETLAYHIDPVYMLRFIITEEDSKKRETISSLINCMKDMDVNEELYLPSSSLLINLIKQGYEVRHIPNIGRKSLTPMQFGIMLYYELYVEQYIKRNSNGGEE